MDDIRKRLIEVLNRCSIIIDEDADSELNLDSFSYINAIIEIENEFGIEIPDYYLAKNIFSSLDGVCEIIRELQIGKSNE